MPTLISIFAILSALSTAAAYVVQQNPRLFWRNLDGLARNIRAGVATLMLVVFAVICAIFAGGTAFLMWPDIAMEIRILAAVPVLLLLIWGALRAKWV